MVLNLNSLACVWRTGHLMRGRGRQLRSVFWRQISTPPISFNTIPHQSAPSLFIPSPNDLKDEMIASTIANEVGTEEVGTGEGNESSRRFPDYCFYSLADRKMVKLNNVRSKSDIVIPDNAICVGSSHGWLAYFDPSDLAVFLTNPLVSPVPPIICLPSLKTLPGTINKPFARWDRSSIYKLVMSSAPSSDNNNNCTVMAMLNIKGHRLAFCKLGDSSWTVLENKPGTPDDLTYSGKDQLFYCRYFENIVESWNLSNPHSPRRIDITEHLIHGLPDYPESEKKLRDQQRMYDKDYLVMDSYSGDVLLLTRHSAPIAKDGTVIDWTRDDHNEMYNNGRVEPPMSTLRFDVYRLSASARGGWDYVTDLGDGVMFVGLNQAFYLSARDFAPGVLIPNSIYFAIDPITNYSLDIGIYNMQDFTVKPLFWSHLHPFNKIDKPPNQPAMWFYPNPWNN